MEAAFYQKAGCFLKASKDLREGHAERLLAAGCTVPRPLHVEHGPDGVIICMTKLEGREPSGV